MCDQKVWNVFDQFGICIACSGIYFVEVGARVSLKVTTKGSIRGFTWKFRVSGRFSAEKREECDQKVWNVFDQFGICIACSGIYFVEVGARVSLKVTTKGSIRGFTWKFRVSGRFSAEKREECDQKVWNVFDQFGICIVCSGIYFVEVGARVWLKVTTKGSIRG